MTTLPGLPLRVLLLTMPGVGVQTLRQLDADPRWPRSSVRVGLIARRPGWARWCAARARLWWRGLKHPQAWRAEGPLAAMDARRWLTAHRYDTVWLDSDEEVRRLRAAWQPELTLTISSRIVFSAPTLAAGTGDWLNVHPGLLPRYAGASPVPYMFLDGVAGCTIHHMAERIDAGAIVDRAQIDGDLGQDGAELLYERLPRLMAERVGEVVQAWREGRLQPEPQLAGSLRHCTSRQLQRDRQLDWSWAATRLERWVRALTPYAPAFFIDGAARRCEVRRAQAQTGPAGAAGMVLERRGRAVRVACRGGSLWLECAARPRLHAGDVLVAPQHEHHGG